MSTPPPNYEEKEVHEFAASLSNTLAQNGDLNKMTVYIDTGEPVEGFTGSALFEHAKQWTSLKKNSDLMDMFAGLMYLRICVCVATQEDLKIWTKFKNSDAYLYGFNVKNINLMKCPTKGAKYTDNKTWNDKVSAKYDETSSVAENKQKSSKITYNNSISITFTTKPKKSASKQENVSQTMKKKEVKVNEYKELTASQIEKLQQKVAQEQQLLNKSQSKKGAKVWKWKENQKKKHNEIKIKLQTNEEKRKRDSQNRGGAGGVVSSYAYFDDEKQNENKNYGSETPVGSDDIANYQRDQTIQVWSESKKNWVDGQVLEVIKFLKTMKVSYDGKTQQFRLPNVKMIRLKDIDESNTGDGDDDN